MKNYMKQIFFEGLGATIYAPVRRVIEIRIDSIKIKKSLIGIISVLYFIIAISLATFLFLLTYPL